MDYRYNPLFFPGGCLSLGCLLSCFLLLSLMGGGFPWLLGFSLLFFLLLLILPPLLFFTLRWWLNRNVLEGDCPSCKYHFFAFKNSAFSCPNCGESLLLKDGAFVRQTPPGTVEVEAVEVEDSSN